MSSFLEREHLSFIYKIKTYELFTVRKLYSNGAIGQNRTADLQVTNLLLYQLSYNSIKHNNYYSNISNKKIPLFFKNFLKIVEFMLYYIAI